MDSSGKRLRQAAIHRELQAFLTQNRRALIELPRDHGKSVQVCARVLWELGHDPSLRVKFVCATDALAAERSRFLRDAISDNPAIQLVFPELKSATPWSVEAFTVRRPASVIGPSVAAFGIGAGSTGARADLLICDDIVDVRSLHSRADRERVKADFHNNLMNLLEPDGRFWGLCTPWHNDDLNALLKKNPAFKVFRRAIDTALTPIWPEKWPTRLLQERRDEIGEASFARGYRLVAIEEGELTILPEWVRTWSSDSPLSLSDTPMSSSDSSLSLSDGTVLAIDPAVSAKEKADASALVLLGRFGNEVRCLSATALRVSMPELVQRIAEIDEQCQPDVILFESNAAFAGIRDLLIRHASFGSKVIGEAQTKSKASRIASFSVLVQNGTFRLKGDGSQRELFEEMTMFPFAAHDDLLDAAAMGSAYLLRSRPPRIWT